MQHRTEATALVYLRWDPKRSWYVDPVTVDGHPLDPAPWMYEPDVIATMTDACECDDPKGCAEQARQALDVPLPTGPALLRLLADAQERKVRS